MDRAAELPASSACGLKAQHMTAQGTVAGYLSDLVIQSGKPV